LVFSHAAARSEQLELQFFASIFSIYFHCFSI